MVNWFFNFGIPWKEQPLPTTKDKILLFTIQDLCTFIRQILPLIREETHHYRNSKDTLYIFQLRSLLEST